MCLLWILFLMICVFWCFVFFDLLIFHRFFTSFICLLTIQKRDRSHCDWDRSFCGCTHAIGGCAEHVALYTQFGTSPMYFCCCLHHIYHEPFALHYMKQNIIWNKIFLLYFCCTGITHWWANESLHRFDIFCVHNLRWMWFHNHIGIGKEFLPMPNRITRLKHKSAKFWKFIEANANLPFLLLKTTAITLHAPWLICTAFFFLAKCCDFIIFLLHGNHTAGKMNHPIDLSIPFANVFLLLHRPLRKWTSINRNPKGFVFGRW